MPYSIEFQQQSAAQDITHNVIHVPLGYNKKSKRNKPCDLCGPGSGTPDEGAEWCTRKFRGLKFKNHNYRKLQISLLIK